MSQPLSMSKFSTTQSQAAINPSLMKETGNIPERDMFNTYNMGVGMSVVVAPEDVERAIEILRANGEDAYVIGEIIKSEDGVVLC